jgi:hypothetical protein
MEMPMKGFGRQPVEQSLEYIMESGKFKNKIRMFTVTRNRSFEKDEWDCKGGEWQCATPKATADMSATTYFFARNIIDNVDFPIGIITSNWGGTRIESWMPKQALIEVLAEDGYAAAQKAHSIKPTELYCAMLAPIRQFNAKGFLWYQGCSNLGDVTTYDKLQARMVKQWREDWGDKENKMPFYFVMIAPYSYGDSNAISYPRFVETQVRSLSLIPNSGMAATTDAGMETCIHPAKKLEVGQRLAALALVETYGHGGFEHKAPQYAKHEIKDGKVTIEVNPAVAGEEFTLWLRIPTWCGEQFVPGELYSYADNNQSKVVVKVNGKRVRTNVVDGYMPVQRAWNVGDKVELELPMPVRYSVADERVEADVNRVCITRGPLVYCAEQPDNEFVASTYVVNNIGDQGKVATFSEGIMSGINNITLKRM